jgi:2,3-bisphosphoglycerate-dependent phosphoglycerate mutase
MKRVLLALAVLFIPCAVFAQPAVFLVRHAERADAGTTPPPGADPDLSAAGRARAERLAAMLKDARIGQIFVTEFKRTRQTAEPLAKLLGVEATVIIQKDVRALADRLKSASTNVLVIGHTNTLPEIVKVLDVADRLSIGETEFDNLFIVVRSASPSLLQLRYQ